MPPPLLDLINQSVLLEPQRKEIYIQILPLLTEVEQSKLATLLTQEQEAQKQMAEKEAQALSEENKRLIAEADALIKNEIRKNMASQEEVEKTKSESILSQLDQL